MSEALRDLPVLVLDCQAAGATPAYGDLLELGWAVSTGERLLAPARSHWILPRTERRVSRAVRELTGWSEACLGEALSEEQAYRALLEDLRELGLHQRAPTAIHFARFELPFLRDLHERLASSAAFPFDTVCLHAVSTRLFPSLPRRNIRALAGYLGHSPELVRRCLGHVEATGFIWRALLGLLEERSVYTWDELRAFVESAPSARRTRAYPIAPERRRALPDAPGVYRFVRKNGDIIYVGKATSLKKRVASHFTLGARATERGLEMLTQVADIVVTPTATVLEAALLECDEIKRIDPPYNVQLRKGERSAWFAGRDWFSAAPQADEAHPIGPIPSERALSAFGALIELARGAEPSRRLLACALAVPSTMLPELALFDEGYRGFVADHLPGLALRAAASEVQRASRALWLARGRSEPDASPEDAPPDHWDLARVRRRLERNLVQGGLLVRRARWLSLLADADVAFREREAEAARLLIVQRGEVLAARTIARLVDLRELPARPARARRQRQAAFDAPTYDRVRVIATELRRVHDEGGEVSVRFGGHVFDGPRLLKLIEAV